MTYKNLIDRVVDNVGIEEINANVLRSIKNDMKDTLITIFGKSRYPHKVFYKSIPDKVYVEEDFSDSMLIDDLSITRGSISGGKYTADNPTVATGLIVSTSPNGFYTLDVAFGTIVGSYNMVITLVDSDSNTIFTDTTALTSANSDTTETITISHREENVTLNILFDFGSSGDSVEVDTLQFTYYQNGIKMPSDFFLPLEVIYQATNYRYESEEMLEEQYLRWIPNIDSQYSETFTAEISEDLMQVVETEENQDFDNKIGYYFRMFENNTRLFWKPNFSGRIEVLYAYLPTLTLTDTDTIQTHEVFTDLIVSGITYRQLKKRLSKARNEVELNAFVILIRETKAEFKDLLADYTDAGRQNANYDHVLPFAWGDVDMEIWNDRWI